MSSLGEQIMSTIFTKVTAAAPTGVTVYRSRAAAVARSEGNAIVIEPEAEEVEYKALPVTKRDLHVVLRYLVRGTVPDTDADGIRVPVHAALMLDRTLGGLALQIFERDTSWTIEEADLTALEMACHYRVIYATAANDLTTAP